MSTESPTILLHNSETGEMAARLKAALPNITVAECNSYEGMQSLVPELKPDVVYSVRFAGTPGFPRDIMLGPDGPRWISVGGSGCDHLGQWDTEQVTVTNSAGVAAAMMAEYVFGSVLNFTLDISGLHQDKAARKWNGARLMETLRGKTILIVGLGHTGQEIATRAKAFGMHVIGTRARPVPTDNVDEVFAADDLPELWDRADVVAVCVPLLASTRGLIDARALAAMKPTTILADVSRGGVVEGSALINALRNGTIAAAALDVFETEPLPPDNPIWELENVILSPHCSSVYEGWEMESFEMFIENLRRWQRGEQLHNIVDPTRGY